MEKEGKYFLSSEESVDEGVSSRLMETSVQNDETKGGALTNAFIRGDIGRKENNFILSYCVPPLCFREKSSLSTIVYRVVGNDSVKNSSAITGRKDTTRKCARKEIMAVFSEKRRFPPHLRHTHTHTQTARRCGQLRSLLPSCLPLQSARRQVDNFQTFSVKPRCKSTVVAVIEFEPE